MMKEIKNFIRGSLILYFICVVFVCIWAWYLITVFKSSINSLPYFTAHYYILHFFLMSRVFWLGFIFFLFLELMPTITIVQKCQLILFIIFFVLLIDLFFFFFLLFLDVIFVDDFF